MPESSRQIFLHGPYGMRQLQESLGDIMVSLLLGPEDLWLVSPWVSDFDLLDNRAGQYDSINPAWGPRYVRFSELLAAAIESGSSVKFVTKRDEINRRFFSRLTEELSTGQAIFKLEVDRLHTKGLLGSSFFLAGSMNFTYSGTHRNDERIQLVIDRKEMSDARIEFESRYSP
jgi:phosphatidylserine/phosphatidylglycerophosphate/cardiolipin synthase-like enzyme